MWRAKNIQGTTEENEKDEKTCFTRYKELVIKSNN